MQTQNFVFLRIDKKNVKVNFKDIIYIQASGNYVNVVTDQQIFMTLLSLRQLEEILPSDNFQRINRSFIISLNHVTAFDCAYVYIGDMEISVGEHYRDVLPSRVKIIQSDVRHQSPVTRGNVISIENIIQHQTASN